MRASSVGRRIRRSAAVAIAAASVAGAVAAPAGAVVPETAVAGAGSKWFSGSLIQQPGQNCSIIGSPYTEIMISGIGAYGGGSGVIKVGDQYWTSLLLAVPGNPCGSGSAGISTDLILPRATAIDPTRPIRCFYLSRNATSTSDFAEVTGQRWSAFGSSGDVCPAQASPSPYHPGALNIGFRPLANGAQLEIFVPVRSTATLDGAGGPDKFSWVTDATGVYANPGLSSVFANVFAGSGGDQPFVYFAREPSAIPFWKGDAAATPVDVRNRTEFFANFYVAGKPGTVSFEIRRTDTTPSAFVIDSSSPAAAFNGAVAAGQDLIQILPAGEAIGPNGGYAPFAWDNPGEWDTPMTITWRFTPSAGSPVSGSQSFRTLAGPDGDGDGVADIADACPAVAGTAGNGCLPAATPDPDGDGIYGSLDNCPALPAPGVVGGCPPGGEPAPPGPTPPGASPPPAAPPQLVATLRTKRDARLRAGALRAGLKVKLACSRDATAKVALTVAKATGKRLGLKGKRPVVARATGRCTAAKGATVTLRPAKKTIRRIGKLPKPAAATLTVALSAPGATAGGAKVAVKLG